MTSGMLPVGTGCSMHGGAFNHIDLACLVGMTGMRGTS